MRRPPRNDSGKKTVPIARVSFEFVVPGNESPDVFSPSISYRRSHVRAGDGDHLSFRIEQIDHLGRRLLPTSYVDDADERVDS